LVGFYRRNSSLLAARVLHRMNQSIRLQELHQSVQVILNDGHCVDILRRGCENGCEESKSVDVWGYEIVFGGNEIARALPRSQ
jgi:hypothetical protein